MNESRSFADLFRTSATSPVPLIDCRDTRHLARREDFRLGNATVRPSIRTVEGPAGSALAEPRVMQVLVALADAAGSVVTREDLMHSCWKDQIVGDDSVNRAIKEVRRIARECDAGFAVETIPRIGFRLNAQPAPGGPPQPAVADGSAGVTEPGAIVTRRTVLAAGAAGVAALGGGLAWLGRQDAPTDRIGSLLEQSQVAMRSGNPAQEQRALKLLEQAVEQEPARADAWGLLALTRARIDEHVIDDTIAPLHAVNEAADRALQIDPANADAKAALALAVPYYGDWRSAGRRFDEVLDSHPDHVFARDAQSFFFGAVGQMQRSAQTRIAFLSRAPLDANLYNRSVYAHWFLGQIDEADRASARGLEMWPQQAPLWFARLWVLASTGRIERALAHVVDDSARPPLPDEMVQTLRLALSAAQSGNGNQTEAAIARIMGSVQGSVAAVVNAMMLLNLLGAIDETYELSEAYFLESGRLIAAMRWRPGQPVVPDQRRRKTNMLFAPTTAGMREDQRFLPLLERIGLVGYWEQEAITPDFLL